MALPDYEHVRVTTREEWREWLSENADRDQGIWLVTYRRHTERPAPSYEDIVCEALCFGWIDSTIRTLDDERNALLLTPRKPTSTWSASNKARLEHLLPAGLVTERGLRAVEVAKANGSWTILEAVDSLQVPDDLAEALGAAGAREIWDSFTASARKQMLWQVISAKRPGTRSARITRIADEAAAGRKAWG
ncbi:MAG: hypothetical protein E6Q90_11075 [Actinobacteria bacterium]|nr:MAG: hypothetical protein E6Q90_11075 [Actinomycetota bacterium]